MPLNQGFLAENVRRLAGMHLVPMDRLAQYVGVSRQAIANMVAMDPTIRSMPKADTAIKLAEAFNVPLNSLYQDPLTCLRDAVEGFEDAPIRKAVEVPDSVLKKLAAKKEAINHSGVVADFTTGSVLNKKGGTRQR